MSIKNKLVTAVTTAGLLAGLFGSAFVPAAYAAEQTPGEASSGVRCVAATTDADVVSRGNEDSTCYVLAGKLISLDVDLGDGSNAVNDTIAGGITLTVPIGSEVFPEYDAEGIVTKSSSGRVATFNTITMATLNTNAAFRIAVRSHATVGSSYAVLLELADGTDLGTLTLTSVSAATAGVASAVESSASAKCTAGTGGSGLLPVGGARCADTGVEGIPVSGIYSVQLVTEDAYGVAITEAGYIKATLTGSATGGIEALDNASCAGATNTTSASFSYTSTDGGDSICFTSDGTAGTATLTITTGPLTYVRNIVVRGSIATLAITGPSALASDLDADDLNLNDALGVECKDSAGNVFGDGGGKPANGVTESTYTDGDMTGCTAANLSFTVTDGNDSSIGAFTDAAAGTLVLEHTASRFDDGAVGTNDDGQDPAGAAWDDEYSEADNGYWDIPVEVCVENDEGEARKIKVTSGLVSSNVLTLTCVSSDVKITSMTALATGTSGSATSGKNGQTIKVKVEATDGAGRPAGLGATFTFTTDPSWSNTNGTADASFSAGSATLTISLPANSGSQYVIYSATDGDTSTVAKEAYVKKIAFTVTNEADALADYVLSKKGSKVTGSNFSARATVKVEVENASKGTVKVFTRRANSAGKVVYTVAGRGTFYVTMYTGAAGSEVLSNTVTVRR